LALSVLKNNPAIRRIERLDPVSLVFAAHAIALALTGNVLRPVLVISLVAAMVVLRFALREISVARHDGQGIYVLRSVISIVIVAAVIAADGGTESPFFFWLLLILTWQALRFRQGDFRILLLVGLAAYIVTVLAAGDITATSIARFGLFVSFALVLSLGRFLLEQYESEIHRLDSMVRSVIDEAPLAVAIYDSDRDTLMFANGTAEKLGLATHDGLARIVPVADVSGGAPIVTLASMIEEAGWEPYGPADFKPIGDPQRIMRIGFHVRRLEAGRPIVFVYGQEH
jgi:hypothetical protein